MINEEIIKTFYTAFKRKDFLTMQNCYADKAKFSDEVFVNLNAKEVRAMWEMLIKKGKDLNIEVSRIQANENSGKAEWQATYTFSKTNRKVINKINAEFIFEDGKIINHVDSFSFYKWARQALGVPGLLFGWSSWLRKNVRRKAMAGLADYLRI
jgi:ketosteroid isomerase-like protein